MIIRNARIVLRDEIIEGAVALHGERIAAISTGSSGAAEAIDFEGDYLLPGLVELHTDNLEKNLMPRPRFAGRPCRRFSPTTRKSLPPASLRYSIPAVGDIDHESVRLDSRTDGVRFLAPCRSRVSSTCCKCAAKSPSPMCSICSRHS
jgi:alpha-D-ribose 1-methylphosphonate 5-triphosphate diphosphatase